MKCYDMTCDCDGVGWRVAVDRWEGEKRQRVPGGEWVQAARPVVKPLHTFTLQIAYYN